MNNLRKKCSKLKLNNTPNYSSSRKVRNKYHVIILFFFWIDTSCNKIKKKY